MGGMISILVIRTSVAVVLVISIATLGGCSSWALSHTGMGFMISVRSVSTTGNTIFIVVSSMTSGAGGNAGMGGMISILVIRTSSALVVRRSLASRALCDAFRAILVRFVIFSAVRMP